MTRTRATVPAAALLAALMLVGCTTVPFTGRSQLNLLSEGEEIKLGAQAYQQTMGTLTLSADARMTALVKRCGARIAVVADRHLQKLGRERYGWEVNLVESKDKNAFALPGGKIVVYTGLLTVMQNEAQLATVMSHEVAHAVARHGAERMSQGLLVQAGAVAAGAALRDQNAETQLAVLAAYGIGASVGVMLPYSRKHEKEADYIGMLLMAEAGYDPQEAVRFWQRFAESKKDKAQAPGFLSTHPTDATRIKLMREDLPEALEIYSSTRVKVGTGESLAVREKNFFGF